MVSGGQQVLLANCQFLYRAFHNAWRNSIKFAAAATVCHFGHCFYGPNKRQTKLKSINKSWRLRPGIVSAIQLADGRLWANWFRSQLLWYSVSSSSSFRLLSQLCGAFYLFWCEKTAKTASQSKLRQTIGHMKCIPRRTEGMTQGSGFILASQTRI